MGRHHRAQAHGSHPARRARRRLQYRRWVAVGPDFAGAIEGFGRLGVDAVYNWPVAVGTGWVDAAHGRLPVPAPATAILLEGVEVASGGPVEGEATTPTGAALVRVLSAGP